MKNILIWGAGMWGRKAFDILSAYKNTYNIVAFGDNDHDKIGQVFCGKPIWGSDILERDKQIDLIIVAASAVKITEIKEQLEKTVLIPIVVYQDMMNQLLLPRISIDISGFCNAKCKWCVTGRKNLTHVLRDRSYMSFEEFCEIYSHLYKNGIIGKSTEIMLYSWGEPLLNKDYVQIVEFLAEQEQRFSVSTNASVLQLAHRKDAYKNCCSFIFSMPGFSEESYARMHGFHFNKIKENIVKISDNLQEHGFAGDGSISFHVYQFNHAEIADARNFSEDLGLSFNPYYPYFNGNSMMEDFLEGRMDETVLNEAEAELYLAHVDELLKKRPKEYKCFLENIISIDCKGNLVLCCAADSGLIDYSWGSIFQISSFEDMKAKREEMLQCQSCQKCRKLGIDYWLGNNPSYLGN